MQNNGIIMHERSILKLSNVPTNTTEPRRALHFDYTYFMDQVCPHLYRYLSLLTAFLSCPLHTSYYNPLITWSGLG